MKKLIAFIAAAACALSTAALAACGGDGTDDSASDSNITSSTSSTSSSSSSSTSSSSGTSESTSESASNSTSTSDSTGGGEQLSETVTSEEWAAALDISNFYNVTIEVTGGINDTYNEKARTDTASISYKYALSENDSGNLVGSIYYDWNETETIGEETTVYYRERYNYIEYDEQNSVYCIYEVDREDDVENNYWFTSADWYLTEDSRTSASGYSVYSTVGSAFSDYAQSYSLFTYSQEDGAYTYTTDSSYSTRYTFTYTVKIADGNLAYFKMYRVDSEGGIYYMDYTLTDIGTTTVTIPDEVSGLFSLNKSEQVTDAELAEILTASRYYKVTVTVNEEGEEYLYSYDLEKDENGYFTGVIYLDDGYTLFYYIIYQTDDGFSKDCYCNNGSSWEYSSENSETSATGFTTDDIVGIPYIMEALCNQTYTYTYDGYYCEYGGMEIELIIKDGELSSIEMIFSVQSSEGSESFEAVYNFYDIGTNTITEPDEITQLRSA